MYICMCTYVLTCEWILSCTWMYSIYIWLLVLVCVVYEYAYSIWYTVYCKYTCLYINFVNNCWVVLVVWASAKSTGRHNFHQNASSGHGGPHTVPKAIGKCRRWPVHQWKPIFVSKNLQDLLSFRSHPSILHFRCGVRSTPVFSSFFRSKSMFLLLLSRWQIFVCCCPTQSSEWCFVNLHGGWETAYPKISVYVITWTSAHWFFLIFPLMAPK
jgi:hypothetical protein